MEQVPKNIKYYINLEKCLLILWFYLNIDLFYKFKFSIIATLVMNIEKMIKIKVKYSFFTVLISNLVKSQNCLVIIHRFDLENKNILVKFIGKEWIKS